SHHPDIRRTIEWVRNLGPERTACRGHHAPAATAAGGVSEPHINGSFELPIPAMTWTLRSIVVAAAAAGLGVTALSARPQTPQPPPSQQPPTPPQQPSEVSTVISG